MKKLFILLIPITLLTLCGCSEYTTIAPSNITDYEQQQSIIEQLQKIDELLVCILNNDKKCCTVNLCE